MVKLDRINLSNEGLTKFFSPIESQIMQVLWENEELTTPEITEKTDIPLSSVAGTLDRLVKAGFATRKLDKGEAKVRYLYSAADSMDNTANTITKKVLDSLVDTFGKVAIENFHAYNNKK
ncbi:BlaI/MecI/CopY family transcriptional regulator [Methanolobus sediminis]|uniref:BlaI/MecI/CopY family transcriptional regulator n=1 Tax=Methanolobus sediminis TaxID=3072978 RepID=A0AA51YJM6_9EURY|nr:BlaI/MecI/CopY family transcriptional regulator [Methanolobus sediminis]WMW25705.1 BlaI/MecI/CopY family transcriptional regulator [Methanolobus sediminis]